MMLREGFSETNKHLAFEMRDYTFGKEFLPWFEQLLKNNSQQSKTGNTTNNKKSELT